jgi:hypothetical protein
MAHLTAFYPDGRMFECKRAALVGVALETGLFISERLTHKMRTRGHPPGRCECAVRIMTIAAGHESFVDAMFERHGKFSSQISVTPVTEFRLALGE